MKQLLSVKKFLMSRFDLFFYLQLDKYKIYGYIME